MNHPQLRHSSRVEGVPAKEEGPSLALSEAYLCIDLDQEHVDADRPPFTCYRLRGMIPLSELTNAHVRLFSLLEEIFNNPKGR